MEKPETSCLSKSLMRSSAAWIFFSCCRKIFSVLARRAASSASDSCFGSMSSCFDQWERKAFSKVLVSSFGSEGGLTGCADWISAVSFLGVLTGSFFGVSTSFLAGLTASTVLPNFEASPATEPRLSSRLETGVAKRTSSILAVFSSPPVFFSVVWKLKARVGRVSTFLSLCSESSATVARRL